MKKIIPIIYVSTLAILSACGGGGGNPGTCNGSSAVCSPNTTTATTTTPTIYVEPSLAAASSVAKQCATPRPANAIDPFTQQRYGDVQGSLTTEKLWLRAFVNETYLWYKDVIPLNPSLFVIGVDAPYTNPSDNSTSTVTLKTNFDVVNTYFNSLRSLQITASGKPKDQFHFTYTTKDWVALTTAGTGVGFGFQVALLASSPPRNALVAYTEPGTAAASNNLLRGAKFVSVNGTDVASGSPDVLNEGLFSPIAGKQYTFQVLDQGSTTPRTITMTASTVTSTPVQNVRVLPAPYNSVGYLQFNEHISTAESQLIAAVNQLKAANNGAGISDLVLDLRYNGGGLLDIASELAYMIAGATATNGKTFEMESSNDKNPFGSSSTNTMSFHNVAQGFSTTFGLALPQLGLSRVFVLTGKGTCSASEAVINGLNGIGINVILIGSTTCGKPYGFFPQDNCSVTYFTIQFKGVNNAGFGDYADGFMPGGTGAPANQLKGCVVADDFTKPLGDITEARLAAALQYRTNGSCPIASVGLASQSATAMAEPALGRSILRENRFYRPSAGH